MGRLFNSLINLVETLAGPADWRRERIDGCTSFSGWFLVHDYLGRIRSQVPGRIVIRDRNVAEVYLYDPPHFVLKHRHGRCLQLLNPNDKWFKLHFDKPGSNFAEAYTYVEHLLTEADSLSS